MRGLIAAVVLMIWAAPVVAHEGCTIIMRSVDKAVLYQAGDACDVPTSPASTFKLTLALIGFDAGLLQSPDAPAVAYDPALDAPFAGWRQTTTPKTWLQNSVVWYSQWMTTRLGLARFQAYLDRLDYGNRDLSGDPGRDNGLTQAWLGSSLLISPTQQAMYLSKLVQRDLPVSDWAYDMFEQSVETFATADPALLVQGKTGSAWIRDKDGGRTGGQVGWFVGWTLPDATRVFVRLNIEVQPQKGFAGTRAKALLRAELPELLMAAPEAKP